MYSCSVTSPPLEHTHFKKTVLRNPSLCPTDAGDHAIVAVSDDARPVPTDLSGNASRSIPIQTGQSWRGCSCRRYGQILFGTEALHQPHHAAEVGPEASYCGDRKVRLYPATEIFFHFQRSSMFLFLQSAKTHRLTMWLPDAVQNRAIVI